MVKRQTLETLQALLSTLGSQMPVMQSLVDEDLLSADEIADASADLANALREDTMFTREDFRED